MAIVFNGPVRTGKTTLAKLLSQHLERPHISLDDTRHEHYPEVGYDAEHARELATSGDFLALARYWHRFDLHNIQRTLQKHPDAVLDFGGGHTLFFEGPETETLKTLLEPHLVLLVLPSPDLEVSNQVLQERLNSEGAYPEVIHQLNRQMVRNPVNFELAHQVIYTEDHTPEETLQVVLHHLASNGT